jgi:SUKH-3 immunity protein
MEFKNKVNQLFSSAGWHPGRNVFDKYQHVKDFQSFPDFLKDFLIQYGDLSVAIDDPLSFAGRKVFLEILPIYAEYEEETDYEEDLEIFGTRIFPFAYDRDEGPGYLIGCDSNGKVYMLGGGDGYFLRGDTFIEGIEKILTCDWSGSLELDLDTHTWKP